MFAQVEGKGRAGPSHQQVAAQRGAVKSARQSCRSGLGRTCAVLVQSHKQMKIMVMEEVMQAEQELGHDGRPPQAEASAG